MASGSNVGDHSGERDHSAFNDVVEIVAKNLGRIRKARGKSLAALARESSVARATLYQLENAQGNPTIDTLFAISDVLRVPLSDLITDFDPPAVREVRAGQGSMVTGPGIAARLLQRFDLGQARIELYELIVTPSTVVKGELHSVGVFEHVLVHTGELRTGHTDSPTKLGPGDYIAFRGDQPHVYEALEGDVQATLLMYYPPAMSGMDVHESGEQAK